MLLMRGGTWVGLGFSIETWLWPLIDSIEGSQHEFCLRIGGEADFDLSLMPLLIWSSE